MTRFRSGSLRAVPLAAAALAVLALTPAPAPAGGPVQQFSYFYRTADGSLVESRNGEPVDAYLFRYDAPQSRIMWQLMTQGLTAHAWYDIWLGDTLVGSAKATARGNLNAVGLLPADDPFAPLVLTITTADGVPVQFAVFP